MSQSLEESMVSLLDEHGVDTVSIHVTRYKHSGEVAFLAYAHNDGRCASHTDRNSIATCLGNAIGQVKDHPPIEIEGALAA